MSRILKTMIAMAAVAFLVMGVMASQRDRNYTNNAITTLKAADNTFSGSNTIGDSASDSLTITATVGDVTMAQDATLTVKENASLCGATTNFVLVTGSLTVLGTVTLGNAASDAIYPLGVVGTDLTLGQAATLVCKENAVIGAATTNFMEVPGILSVGNTFVSSGNVTLGNGVEDTITVNGTYSLAAAEITGTLGSITLNSASTLTNHGNTVSGKSSTNTLINPGYASFGNTIWSSGSVVMGAAGKTITNSAGSLIVASPLTATSSATFTNLLNTELSAWVKSNLGIGGILTSTGSIVMATAGTTLTNGAGSLIVASPLTATSSATFTSNVDVQSSGWVTGNLGVGGVLVSSGATTFGDATTDIVTVGGNLYLNSFQTLTDSATLTTTSPTFIKCNETTGLEITLPDGSTCTGKIFVFKNVAEPENTVTITPAVGTLDGSASNTTLDKINESMMIISDGTNWLIISDNQD